MKAMKKSTSGVIWKAFVLCVMASASSGGAAQKSVVFVEKGTQRSLRSSEGKWTVSDGMLIARGQAARLIAGEGLGAGDFHVAARLRIKGLNNSACGFVLGDSFFGFEGAHGKMFLTGRLFDGAKGTPVGDPERFMADGAPFLFEAIRRGNRLRFMIDGELAHQCDFTEGPVGRIGFVPWRAELGVGHFRATGNLTEAMVDYSPPAEPYRMKDVEGVGKVVLLPPGKGNPRNSEGDFIELKDGRLLFVYTHFTGGSSDHAKAHLASRESRDGGRTWTKIDKTVVPNEGGFNVMSVSLLRLRSGEIALFYVRKNSLKDCRPLVRFSRDEAETWSAPVEVIVDRIGYYVLNNDRVVQLKSGRLIAPLALHNLADYEQPDWAGRILCYVSDDNGRTWKRNPEAEFAGAGEGGSRITVQEPGVLELKDGSVLMWMRTNAGAQYQCRSTDDGWTWSKLEPGALVSPLSPATIERIPSTGDLLAAWNDHRDVAVGLKGLRTPYCVAISRDEGRSWNEVRVMEDDPNGWYCYTAMDFVGGRVILGHCAGDRRKGGLNTTQVTSFPVNWLYR